MVDSLDLKKDDVVKVYNYSENVAWAIGTLDASSTANIENTADGLKVKVDGSYTFYLKLKFGADQVYVAYNSEEVKPIDPTETVYTIMGEFVAWTWNENAENIVDMTKQEDGTYIFVIDSIRLDAHGYQYKLIANHDWSGYQLPAEGNFTYNIEESGDYRLVFVANVTTHEVVLTATLLQQVEIADTYAVVGTCVNGDNWDVAATANEMTLGADGKYTLVLTEKTLEADAQYQYKIVKNHSWSTEVYPKREDNGNATFTVTETAVYTVTYTYDPTNGTCEVTTVKTGSAGPVTHIYSIVGELTGGWEADKDMTEKEEGVYVYTTTFTAEAKTYQYKLRADHQWGVYELPQSGNYEYTFNEAGTYTLTFTFTLAENKLELEATGEATALENVANATMVYAINHTLKAQFAGEQMVNVYNAAGMLIDAQKANGEYNRDLQAGMYIVRIANETFKVLVR